jgi:hypothetical protein
MFISAMKDIKINEGYVTEKGAFGKYIQVTLFIRAFAVRVFVYLRFYFSIMRSMNILSAAKF